MMRIIGKKLIRNKKNYDISRIAIMQFSSRLNSITEDIKRDKIVFNRTKIIQQEKEDLINHINMHRMDTAENIVSWFLHQMPSSYFKQVFLSSLSLSVF